MFPLSCGQNQAEMTNANREWYDNDVDHDHSALSSPLVSAQYWEKLKGANPQLSLGTVCRVKEQH